MSTLAAPRLFCRLRALPRARFHLPLSLSLTCMTTLVLTGWPVCGAGICACACAASASAAIIMNFFMQSSLRSGTLPAHPRQQLGGGTVVFEIDGDGFPAVAQHGLPFRDGRHVVVAAFRVNVGVGLQHHLQGRV